MVRERTPLQVLNEVINIADGRRLTDCIGGHVRGTRLSDEQNAELVGKLIENLSEEDRALLAEIKSEDIATAFKVLWDRPRPEKPITRKRGPVRLGRK
jgi:hypothetical protein